MSIAEPTIPLWAFAIADAILVLFGAVWLWHVLWMNFRFAVFFSAGMLTPLAWFSGQPALLVIALVVVSLGFLVWSLLSTPDEEQEGARR